MISKKRIIGDALRVATWLFLASTLASSQVWSLEVDPERGVLTLAGSIESALPGVVQILNYETADAENPRGGGSGAVIDAADGLVLTNNHVVDGAGRLRVVLRDGRTLEGELIGQDPATDLALLKVDTRDLVEVPMGDSSELRVGDIVLAIGYPFGLDQTVTMGIVSGLGRTGVGAGLEDFIQTDAPINMGNSGGPLLDSLGRIVGVNTAIYSRSGGNVGIAFAVPTSIISVVVGQLRRHGEVRRGVLGVTIRTAASSDGPAGALVTAIASGSAAESAGMQPGDVVTSANGEEVKEAADLTRIIGLLEPDETVRLDIVRNNHTITRRVRIGAPSVTEVARAGDQLSSFGAAFGELQSNDALYGELQGVVVREVHPGGAAANAGIREGDVITQVNQTPVTSLAAFEQVVKGNRGRIVLVIAREGVNALFPVPIQ